MIDGTLPGYWDANVASFNAARGTQKRILSDVTAAAVQAVVSGETALPGEVTVRQRVLTGGCRVIDGLVTSTDTVDKVAAIFIGTLMSSYADMGTVTTTATTNSTVTRNVGSFVTDGYQVGDSIMLFGCTAATAANDGQMAIVTTVAALTLTVSGTTAISVAGTQAAGFRIFKVAQTTVKAIPANSGNSAIIPPVSLFGGGQDPRLDTSGMILGAKQALIVGMTATLSAMPAQVNFTAFRGLY